MIPVKFSFDYDKKHYLCENGISLGDGVSVEVEKKTFANAQYWMLHFKNESNKNSKIFENILDCDTVLGLEKTPEVKTCYKPPKCDCTLTYMSGMVDFQDYMHDDELSATEYLHRHIAMNIGETRAYKNNGGRSSDVMTSFFHFEAMGRGYVVAVGWSGDWKCEFTRENEGMHVCAGLQHARFYLKPGENIRTASILIMEYDGDYINPFRKLIRENFSQSAVWNRRESINAFELWGGLTTEQMLTRIKELQNHGLKFDECWIDAGWYGECTHCDESFTGDWSQHTGDWRINERVHPDRFEKVRDQLKETDTKIMLWLEPERTTYITPVAKEHPEWLLTKENDDNAIINYGVDEAWQYIFDLIANYIETLDISCYRQDFNVELTEFFKAHDEEDRRGITEIYHICGVYKLWEKLLEKFPNLIIDNCSSGGRRVDIETIQRSIPFFRSDYQCAINATAEVLQLHNTNLSCYLPCQGCSTHTMKDTYDVRSCYQTSFGAAYYSTKALSIDEDGFAWAKKYHDEYLSIRRYFSKDYYNHGSSFWDTTSWTVWQYHDPETESGIVMAFRRSDSPFGSMTVALKGIKAEKYSCRDFNSGEISEISNSLKITLPEKRSSVIFEYKAK